MGQPGGDVGFDLSERFQGEGGGGGAVFDAEFREGGLEVFFHRGESDAEDRGDFGICFAARDPEEDFGFAGSEAEGFERLAGGFGGVGAAGCDDDPAQARVDGGDEVVGRDGLGEVVVGAEIHAGADVAFLAPAGEEDERKVSGGGFLSQRFQYTMSVHLGHGDVAHDEIGVFAAGEVDALAAVSRFDYGEAFGSEEVGELAAQFCFVVDDEDSLHGGRRLAGRTGEVKARSGGGLRVGVWADGVGGKDSSPTRTSGSTGGPDGPGAGGQWCGERKSERMAFTRIIPMKPPILLLSFFASFAALFSLSYSIELAISPLVVTGLLVIFRADYGRRVKSLPLNIKERKSDEGLRLAA